AALLAAKKGKSLIGMEDIEAAFMKELLGPQKKTKVRTEKENKLTAYHEAGHAILAYCMPTQDPVRLISIIPSGRALGYTLTPPVEDKYSVYRDGLKEEISMLLAGRAAESIIFGDVSGGASNDIQRATNIARNMVTQLGMSDRLGPILYGSEHNEVFLGRDFSSSRNYSEETAAIIDEEIKTIVENAYKVAKDVLNERIDKLHFIAEFLLKYETMDDAQFLAAMEGDPSFEDLENMANERREKSAKENEERAKRDEAERIKRETEERKAEEEADLERRRNNIGEVLGDDSDFDGDTGEDKKD
ncbi:MAG: zinc metalloprotease, partial [Clostridia bacterium]|nr:zinc metalloprotease [Clostridia bacterium]